MSAPVRIPIHVSPFQGGPTGPNAAVGFNLSSSGSTGACIGASGIMDFVNDGYVTLFVNNGSTGKITCTISGQPDNAGRTQNVQRICGNSTVVGFGPFRPIWFNYGGVVYVSFSGGGTSSSRLISGTKVAAVRSLV